MNHARLLFGMLVISICFPHVSVAEDPNTTRLTRLLTGRSEQHRLTALQSIQNDYSLRMAALDGLILAVESNAKKLAAGEHYSPNLIPMVRTLSLIHRDRARECIVNLLDHKDHQLAMIAADSLAKNRHVETFEALKRQVEHPAWDTVYAFRFSLVHALVELDHPDTNEFLASIRPNIDGQLAYEIDVLLGREPSNQSEDQKILDDKSHLDPATFAPPQYYGINIQAKRVLFILDCSCSMKTPIYGGTRLSHAKELLTNTIEKLPADYKFGVLSFDNKVHQWHDDLRIATDENKQAAIRFVLRQNVGEVRKNIAGALGQAIDFDADLEAVFLVTDGMPKVGPSPDRIIADVVSRNQLRHLKINTIGIGLNPDSRAFLKTLAETCNGEFREPTLANGHLD